MGWRGGGQLPTAASISSLPRHLLLLLHPHPRPLPPLPPPPLPSSKVSPARRMHLTHSGTAQCPRASRAQPWLPASSGPWPCLTLAGYPVSIINSRCGLFREEGRKKKGCCMNRKCEDRYGRRGDPLEPERYGSARCVAYASLVNSRAGT